MPPKCESCTKNATYIGPEQQALGRKAVPRWCRACSKVHEGAMHVGTPKCEKHPDRRATFRLKTSKKATLCLECGQAHPDAEPSAGMCSTCGVTHASFGDKNGGTKKWCKKCAVPHNGVPLSSKCLDCGKRQRVYGIPGGSPQWCSACGKNHEGAVDLHNRKCITCKLRRPTFGHRGDKRASWCRTCCRTMPDVVDMSSKMCEGCGEHQAAFGLPSGRRRWCGKCSAQHPDAINLKHARKCEVCGVRRAFRYKDSPESKCEQCKDKALPNASQPIQAVAPPTAQPQAVAQQQQQQSQQQAVAQQQQSQQQGQAIPQQTSVMVTSGVPAPHAHTHTALPPQAQPPIDASRAAQAVQHMHAAQTTMHPQAQAPPTHAHHHAPPTAHHATPPTATHHTPMQATHTTHHHHQQPQTTHVLHPAQSAQTLPTAIHTQQPATPMSAPSTMHHELPTQHIQQQIVTDQMRNEDVPATRETPLPREYFESLPIKRPIESTQDDDDDELKRARRE